MKEICPYVIIAILGFLQASYVATAHMLNAIDHGAIKSNKAKKFWIFVANVLLLHPESQNPENPD